MLAIVFLILVIIALTISMEKAKQLNMADLHIEETNYNKTGENVLIKDNTWTAQTIVDVCNKIKD